VRLQNIEGFLELIRLGSNPLILKIAGMSGLVAITTSASHEGLGRFLTSSPFQLWEVNKLGWSWLMPMTLTLSQTSWCIGRVVQVQGAINFPDQRLKNN